jgi:phosphoenolpyruvate carboxykinase (GTP)
MKAVMNVDLKAWKAEIPDIEQHFALFGNRLPERLKKQLEEFRKRLG